MKRVYVDNSVIGGCFDEEFSTWSKALMGDFREGRLTPVVSGTVEREAKDPDAPEWVHRQYDALLSYGAEMLTVTDEVEELAEGYQKAGIVSDQYAEDMTHVALATVAGVDVLVSWNFRHIVNLDKIQQFNQVSEEHGYDPIKISTPVEVTTHEKED